MTLAQRAQKKLAEWSNRLWLAAMDTVVQIQRQWPHIALAAIAMAFAVSDLGTPVPEVVFENWPDLAVALVYLSFAAHDPRYPLIGVLHLIRILLHYHG